MSFRRIAMTCGPMASLALALSLTTTASAKGYGSMPPAPHVGPHVGMPAAPSLPALPAAPALPGAPDMRPVWQGAASPMMPDARARDAWMDECHRRTSMYHGGYRKSRRHRDESRRDDRAYGYCEAYFEDYYRTYAQRMPMHAPMMMMSHAPVAQPARGNCVETVTTEYVPVRTRHIPRRPAPRRVVPDKRVRDKRMLMD